MPETARLDAQHYHSGQYTGHMVRVAGKFLGGQGDRMQIQMAGEGAPATVVAGDYAGAFDPAAAGRGHFEVIGTLQQDGTLRAAQVVDLGDNFDMNMYAEMVALSLRFPDLF